VSQEFARAVQDRTVLAAEVTRLVEQLEAARGPSYPSTPVDCLISELRELLEGNVQPNGYLKRKFEERVAQFQSEVGWWVPESSPATGYRDEDTGVWIKNPGPYARRPSNPASTPDAQKGGNDA
jgi:hypothetical protein